MSGFSAAPTAGQGWTPYDDSTGVIYDNAVDGNVLSFESPNFVAGFDYRIFSDQLMFSSTNGNAHISLWKNGAWEQAASNICGPNTATAAYLGIGCMVLFNPASAHPNKRWELNIQWATVPIYNVKPITLHGEEPDPANTAVLEKFKIETNSGSRLWSSGRALMFKRPEVYNV